MSQIRMPGTFLYMPLDAVAAYWLSLRKLLGNSRNMKTLEAEAEFVHEPFVRHLLDMLMSQIAPLRCRQLGETCGKSEIARLDRQLDLMRLAVMDISAGENPLRTLARMTALFPVPLNDPEQMLETAQARIAGALNSTLPVEAYTVDHFLNDDALATTLLFYAALCRRHGKAACRPFLPQPNSVFFTDSLSLVVDGFDAPFVRKWMKRFKTTLLSDMERKITMSIDMCAAIQERIPFEEMRFLVRSHIR